MEWGSVSAQFTPAVAESWCKRPFPSLRVSGILTLWMGIFIPLAVFFFFLRKTLSDQQWTFPYQLFFLPHSWPCSRWLFMDITAPLCKASPGSTTPPLHLNPQVTGKL